MASEETYPIVLIQRPIEAVNVNWGLPWSWLMRRGYLLGKPSQEVTGTFTALLFALSARDLH